MNLSEIKMSVRFVLKRMVGENHYVDALMQEVSCKNQNKNPYTYYPYAHEPLMTDSYYQYTFRDNHPDSSFFGSPNLYILLSVSFKHKDGSITPMPRNREETFLIYRYKVCLLYTSDAADE